MPYKISGTKNETARVLVIKESDWSIESNTVIEGSGAYEVDTIEAGGTKTVTAETTEGETLVFGGITPIYFVPPPGDRGVFCGGDYGKGDTDTIDYITISTPSNAVYFGDLTTDRRNLAAASNTFRGVIGGGNSGGSGLNTIDYITISTLSDAADFGDLTAARDFLAACSNNTRGVFGGGYTTLRVNTIDYITISTLADATPFGDLTHVPGEAGTEELSACSNNTRGVFGGGNNGDNLTKMDYITISTLANADAFGNLTQKRKLLAACSSSTRGVFGGGTDRDPLNTIDYITISTLADANDFGDLTEAAADLAATSNSTRGVFAPVDGSDQVINYVTIATLASAAEFGELSYSRNQLAACSNGHGGLT